MTFDRPRLIILLGLLWAGLALLFALRILTHISLEDVQQYGVAYLVAGSDAALVEVFVCQVLNLGFFYAIISRFHHARSSGKGIAQTAIVFAVYLLLQAILLALGYPSTEMLTSDEPNAEAVRSIDAQFVALVVVALLSHIALIATLTASVWQRRFAANNLGIHFAIGLAAALPYILVSTPPSILTVPSAEILLCMWFGLTPLCFAVSCAVELSPPYLLRLPRG